MIGTPHIWRRMLGTRGRFGILQRVPGAAAAFSLARLNDSEIDPVVNTLRNSDGAEKFWHPQEILWGHATEWANEEYLAVVETFDSATGHTFFGTVTVTGGVLQFNNPGSDCYNFKGYSGKKPQTYRVEYTISNYVSGNVRLFDFGGGGHGLTRSANGTYVENITITGNTNWGFRGQSGFVGDIDNFTATQLTSDLLVTDLYEQQNGVNHASQINEAKMPKLIEAGVMVTKNGLPAIKFHATTVRLEALINATQPFTVIQTMADITTNGLYYDSSAGRSYSRQSANTNWLSFSGAEVNAGAVADLSDHMIAAILHNRANSVLRRNGVATGLVGDIGPNTMGTLVINASAVFKLQDMIVYDDDITANIAAIEKDRMDYYKIPQP